MNRATNRFKVSVITYSRITSYNVCYTKLLRLEYIIKNELDEYLDLYSTFVYKLVTINEYGKSSNGLDNESRITSYNVCYTKLLRSKRPNDPNGL